MDKRIIFGMVSALLLFIVVAALAPMATADVNSQAGFSLDKQTYPDSTASYKVGDPISYRIVAINDGIFNCEVDIWDLLPDNTTKIYLDNDSYFTVGQSKTYWVNDTVKADWVTIGTSGNEVIRNSVWAVGLDENPTAPDDIEMYMVKTNPIIEKEPPEFNFNYEGTGCLEVEFDGEFTADPDVTIVDHTWTFGDSSTSGVIAGSPTTIKHTYATCGDKTVTLSGWASNGLSGSFTDVIYVACPPKAYASADPRCFEEEGTMITFTGSATTDPNVPGLTISSWSWSFSDGTTDTGQVVTRTVAEPITATLTVKDTNGCTDTATVSVGPCTQAPLLTPIGLIALLGALSAVLILGIRRKVR